MLPPYSRVWGLELDPNTSESRAGGGGGGGGE